MFLTHLVYIFILLNFWTFSNLAFGKQSVKCPMNIIGRTSENACRHVTRSGPITLRVTTLKCNTTIQRNIWPQLCNCVTKITKLQEIYYNEFGNMYKMFVDNQLKGQRDE